MKSHAASGRGLGRRFRQTSWKKEFVMVRSKTVLASLIALLTVVATARAADTYKLDPVHSFATFRIKHLNTSYSFGRFMAPSGSFKWDEANPADISFDLTIQTDKIDTGVAQRDNHLKSPDFFDAKQFPTITFKSTSAKKNDDGTMDVTGDLTIHGTTKPLTVTLEKVGEGPGMQPGSQLLGLCTRPFTIKRSDFGVNGLPQAVGDEVTLVVAIEAQKQ
jgi:polyisoprenoid-binding protein YceI